MFRDAVAVLKEMALGLLWPINAPLEWSVGHMSKWSPGQWFKMIEIVGVLAAIVVIFVEFRIEKPIDRAVRIATLFAQIAQVHALPNKEGLGSLKPSVEALANEKVPMDGINLSGADLNNAEMSGARMYNSDLSAADLQSANLSDATLFAANLSGANLFNTNLSGTSLIFADFNRAKFRLTNVSGAIFGLDKILKFADEINQKTIWPSTKGLTQTQLDEACADPKNPPKNLPFDHDTGNQLVWNGAACP